MLKDTFQTATDGVYLFCIMRSRIFVFHAIEISIFTQ
jgi:hypothetical protein